MGSTACRRRSRACAPRPTRTSRRPSGTVNTALQSLQGINDQIVQATAAGGDTTALFDARDQALTTLSGLMGVTYFVSSDGRANVYTTSGEQLVGSQAATLS